MTHAVPRCLFHQRWYITKIIPQPHSPLRFHRKRQPIRTTLRCRFECSIAFRPAVCGVGGPVVFLRSLRGGSSPPKNPTTARRSTRRWNTRERQQPTSRNGPPYLSKPSL